MYSCMCCNFLSCKKDEADSVTPDSTMLTREHLYPENGFISGIIKGKPYLRYLLKKHLIINWIWKQLAIL